MRISYSVAPGLFDWAKALFDGIAAFKAGTFDASAAYEQFAWLIVPEVPVVGADGPFTAYFAVKAPDAGNQFSVLSPITDVSVWFVKNGEPDFTMIYADGLELSFTSVLSVGSATDLEKLILRGDDYITYLPDTPDRYNDVVHGWDGNDDISLIGSGGTDRVFGGAGNDRIGIADLDPATLAGVPGHFFGYGEAGNDTIQGDDRGDFLSGGRGNDWIQSYGGRDTLTGGRGNDVLQGGVGNDSLAGGKGADSILGGLGTDTMTGNAGADFFIFGWGGPNDTYDCATAETLRDVVTDFTVGEDHIRLVELSLATVTLRGGRAFQATDQVRWVSDGVNTTIYINGDDDLKPEMAITLLGVTDLHARDFSLFIP